MKAPSVGAGRSVLRNCYPSASSSFTPCDGMSVRLAVGTQHTPALRTLTRAGGQVLDPELREGLDVWIAVGSAFQAAAGVSGA